MPPQTIAIIGGLDADLIMTIPRIPNTWESLPANSYSESLGGKGANSAIAAYRSCHKRPRPTQDKETPIPNDDIKVKLIGAVGHDQYREKFITNLNNNGIDTSSIVTVPNTHSSVCFVMIEHPTRENSCLFYPGATATWRKEDFMKVEQLGGGGGVRPDLAVAQMEIAEEVVAVMIETAGKAGIDFSLNAAPAAPIGERFYRYLTHLTVIESEAAIMSGERGGRLTKIAGGQLQRNFWIRG